MTAESFPLSDVSFRSIRVCVYNLDEFTFIQRF